MTQIKNSDQKRKLNNLFTLFLADLQNLYPNYIFKPSSRFHFHPPRTIYYETNLSSFKSFALQLLHELGHAVSNHRDYHCSIERLKIETEAWQVAETIYNTHSEWKSQYHLSFDKDFAESHLDTYRHWLHQKSTCQKCGLTMFQNKKQQWVCPHCDLF
jgi:hypothetical protein cdiviTM7_01560